MNRLFLPCLAVTLASCGASNAGPAPSSSAASVGGSEDAEAFGDLVRWTPKVAVASSECGRDAALREATMAALETCTEQTTDGTRGMLLIDVEDDGKVTAVEVRSAGVSCALYEGDIACAGVEDEDEDEGDAYEDEYEEYGEEDDESDMDEEGEMPAPPFSRCLLETLAEATMSTGCRESATVAFGATSTPPTCESRPGVSEAGAFRGLAEPWLMICDPSKPDARWTVPDPLDVRSLEASPRGGYFVATNGEDALTLVQLSDGRTVSLEPATGRGAHCFSPDESAFAGASGEGWQAVALPSMRVMSIPAPPDAQVACGPGRLAVPENDRVVVHRIDGGEAGTIPVEGVVEGVAFDADGGLVIDTVDPESDGDSSRITIAAEELP